MTAKDKNPLGLENKMYSIEEFGSAVREKLGGDNYLSNLTLGQMFLDKYPVYSCQIKKPENHISKKDAAAVSF